MNLSDLSIRQKLAFFSKTAIFYGGASAFNKVLSLLTFPIITRHFSTAEYGLIDFYGVISGLLLIISMFGIEAALGRLFYHYESESDRKKLVTQIFIYQIAISLTISIILYAAASWALQLLPDGSRNLDVLRIIIMQLPILMVLAFSQNLLFYTHAKKRYVFLSIGSSLLTVCVLSISFLNFDISVYEYFLLIFCSNLCFAILALFLVRKWFVFTRTYDFIPAVLKISIPIGVSSIISSLIPMIERWIITDNLGIDDLGTYAVATRIASLPVLMLSALLTPWGAFSISIHKNPDAIKIFNIILKFIVLSSTLFAFFVSAIGYPLLMVLTTEKYIGSLILIFPIALALFMPIISSVTELGIILSKQTKYYIYINLFHLISMAIFLYLFATNFGLLGVALGVMFAQLARFIFGALLSNYCYPLDWAYRDMILFMTLSLFVGLLIVHFGVTFSPILLMMIFFVGLILVAIMGFFLIIKKNERDVFIALIAKRLSV